MYQHAIISGLTRYLLIALCVPALPAMSESIYQSEGDWEVTVMPAQLGYDAEALTAVDELVEAGNTTCLIVTVGDDLLYLKGPSDRISYLASVRKSVLALLYGKYVEDGTVDLDATLEALAFDDIQGLLPIEKQATVKHLLTARSGIYHPASNEGDSREFAPERGSKEAGTYFLYNNWDFNAAGAVLEQVTGRNIYDIFEADLVEPLGFQDFRRRIHKKSGDSELSDHLAYHFHLSTRDMARLGYLMLRDGDWFGEQVVSADWARRIRSTVTPLDEMNPEEVRQGDFAYGYMWWTYEGDDPRLAGCYTGMGAYGQFITVIPRLDMVIAHKTAPSMGDRLKYEEDPDKISVLLEDYLDMVRAVVDAKQAGDGDAR